MKKVQREGWQQRRQPLITMGNHCSLLMVILTVALLIIPVQTVAHMCTHPRHPLELTSITIDSESRLSMPVWMSSLLHALPKGFSHRELNQGGCYSEVRSCLKMNWAQNSHQSLAANVVCLPWTRNSLSCLNQQLSRERGCFSVSVCRTTCCQPTLNQGESTFPMGMSLKLTTYQ